MITDAERIMDIACQCFNEGESFETMLFEIQRLAPKATEEDARSALDEVKRCHDKIAKMIDDYRAQQQPG